MSALFIDSSVLIPSLLGGKPRLRGWQKFQRVAASALIELECIRTLERWRLAKRIDDGALGAARETLRAQLEATALVQLSSVVFMRAKGSFSAPIGSLDALHLASAMLWQETKNEALTFATHDVELAIAARASGLKVIGV